MKTKYGIDWEKQLPEEIFTYLSRIFEKKILTDFQENQIRELVSNAFKQERTIVEDIIEKHTDQEFGTVDQKAVGLDVIKLFTQNERKEK